MDIEIKSKEDIKNIESTSASYKEFTVKVKPTVIGCIFEDIAKLKYLSANGFRLSDIHYSIEENIYKIRFIKSTSIRSFLVIK